MSYTDYVLPAEWASAIVNGDYSSLDSGSIFIMEYTLEDLGLTAARCVTVTSHTIFTYNHDAAGVKATDCLIYSFVAN